MTPEQLHQFRDEMRGHIQEVIKETVNGKIDRLHKEMTAFIERAEPAIQNFENIKWGYKVILGAAMFIGIVGGAVITMRKLFNL